MNAGIKIRIAAAVVATAAIIVVVVASGALSDSKKTKPHAGESGKTPTPPPPPPPPVIPDPPPVIPDPPPPTPTATSDPAALLRALTPAQGRPWMPADHAREVLAALGPDPFGDLSKLLAADAPSAVKANALWAARAISARGRVEDLVDQPYPEGVAARDPRLVDAVRSLAVSRDEDDRVRAAAITLLPTSAEWVPTLQSIVAKEDRAPVLLTALQQIEKIPLKDEEVSALHKRAERLLLDSEDPMVRARAADTFRRGTCGASAPAILHALGAERDPGCRRAFLDVVAYADDRGLAAYALRSGVRLQSDETEAPAVTLITGRAFEHSPAAFLGAAQERFAARPADERASLLGSLLNVGRADAALSAKIRSFLEGQRGGADDAAVADAIKALP